MNIIPRPRCIASKDAPYQRAAPSSAGINIFSKAGFVCRDKKIFMRLIKTGNFSRTCLQRKVLCKSKRRIRFGVTSDTFLRYDGHNITPEVNGSPSLGRQRELD